MAENQVHKHRSLDLLVSRRRASRSQFLEEREAPGEVGARGQGVEPRHSVEEGLERRPAAATSSSACAAAGRPEGPCAPLAWGGG